MKHRPSPALVVAVLALVVAMAGTSYAVTQIGSAQIKNNSVKGKDVTADTLGGGYVADPIAGPASLDLKMSFTPPVGDNRRYQPFKLQLINDSTGKVEDAFTVDLSSILNCSTDSDEQILATGPSGKGKLSFRALDPAAPAGQQTCMQHVASGWITRNPVVFSNFVPSVDFGPAGGYTPHGLWLYRTFGAHLISALYRG